MDEKYFITIKDFGERFSLGKTKTQEIINDEIVTTAKIGCKTLILTSSALKFASDALRKGNRGEQAAAEFLNELSPNAHPLCNIHSGVNMDEHQAPEGESSCRECDTKGGSPGHFLKGNRHD